MRYTNPVYPHECADPFVLYHQGAFWCYRTGRWPDGRVFGILRSPDLVHWQPVGAAMDALPEGYPHYWAPEVSYDNGVFYLYYATGDEVHMHLRVATSRRPEGPFVDSGRRLTREQFAIDAHVFVDDDGLRYLFYATDFLDYQRIGTGTVVDRMLDPFTLAGQPVPVTRAQYDWQIYDPQRAEKGGVRWHTVEGSFVLKHKGRYYQMFSGGNYQNQSYGVGYAVSGQVYSPEEWRQEIDGERTFPVLRSVAGRVKGPGHNSVVAGPDHRQMICAYHVILDQEKFERVLAIDRLEWVGERLHVLGPTYTPQPAPPAAESLLAQPLAQRGRWQAAQGALDQPDPAGSAAARYNLAHGSFLFQVYPCFRAASSNGQGRLSVALTGGGADLHFSLAETPTAIAVWQGRDQVALALPAGFDPYAAHCWQIEVDGREVAFAIQGSACRWRGRLDIAPTGLELAVESAPARFGAPDITYGFEDRFEQAGADLASLGWQTGGPGEWYTTRGVLVGVGVSGQPARLEKALALVDWEWVVNLRLVEGSGLWLHAGPQAEAGLRLSAAPGGGWQMRLGEQEPARLPAGFDPAEFQHFRLRKEDGRLRVAWFLHELGDWPAPHGAAVTGLGVDPGARAEFDLVRLTRL